MARRSKTLLLAPIAAACQIAALGIMMVLLKEGKGLDVKNKSHYVGNEYFAWVDASNYTAIVNGTKAHGLPDGLDFNKTKDFFVIFSARYCSGIKGNGTWNINFCSYGGKEFFDHRVWAHWGMNLLQTTRIIDKAPAAIFGLGISSFSISIVSLFGAYAMMYYHQMIAASAVLSFVVATLTTATAVIAHIYATALVSFAKHIKPNDMGVVTVKYGKTGTTLLWAAAACSLAAPILYFIVCIWDYRARHESSASETTEYKAIDEESHEMTDNGSQTTLVPPNANDFAKEDSAYEPFRNQAASKSKE